MESKKTMAEKLNVLRALWYRKILSSGVGESVARFESKRRVSRFNSLDCWRRPGGKYFYLETLLGMIKGLREEEQARLLIEREQAEKASRKVEQVEQLEKVEEVEQVPGVALRECAPAVPTRPGHPVWLVRSYSGGGQYRVTMWSGIATNCTCQHFQCRINTRKNRDSGAALRCKHFAVAELAGRWWDAVYSLQQGGRSESEIVAGWVYLRATLGPSRAVRLFVDNPGVIFNAGTPGAGARVPAVAATQ